MKNGKSTTASCKAACPAGVDVPRYIRYIRAGKFTEALAVIREKIPFPAVCGYACIHPCESKCARVQYDEPVAIRLLKRAAQEYGQVNEADIAKAPATGKKVAIVGAGPCGLTAAYYLARNGHEVKIFEALPAAGGMMRYGIPEYRLPNDVLDKEISLITRQGVEIVNNTKITGQEELFNKGYDVVLFTVGAWQGTRMSIEGEESTRVLNGISFLKDVNSGNNPAIGKKVVVVGGGNTAVDAARAAVRLGSEVTMVYRRTRAEMPAGPEEISDALEEGVRIEYLTAPVKITEKSITCIKMTLGPTDSSGRPAPVPVEGSEYIIECNNVILAVGQKVDAQTLSLEANDNGTIKVDRNTLATSRQSIFAAGDAVTGPSSIIEAIAQGRQVSSSIDKFLGGSGIIDLPAEKAEQGEMQEESPRGTLRVQAKYIPVDQRLNGFNLIELGYDKQAAMAEAQRCLACDRREFKTEVNFTICKGCQYCKEVCTLDVFEISDTFNPQGYKPSVAARTENCIGCLKCLYVCPDFAISMQNICQTT
ncbi:FAD-dependent oxidoreductase [Desulfoscipio geothermicus]|uniref:Putative selenate reductase, YgfK subunit n=1 Tax=Desulfoscipio geothermicus DSM 3669 TaxID=1121426 RepID=A0A1I6D5Y5_9FIRM|nr:FAD-dependent oxidoreductase [Desulfoscipio geothermicus]SFR00879.1 putative selenate reductase, YgfK subunit [Desulfoscipio geothermicus DSM 3669]